VRLLYFLKDFFIPKEVIHIQDQSSFEDVLKDFKKKRILALDTEFLWKNTYYPRLSLIQVSTGTKIYILDCVLLDISKLNGILSDENIMKIFHSIRGDSSVLYNCLGAKIKNIFDTQLAEDILFKNNGGQISYKNLVKKYFFIELSKSETNSNWEKRPLRNEQINYAAEDVRYLHYIMKIQVKLLKKSNKLKSFYSICEKEKNLGEEDFLNSRLRRLLKKNRKITDTEIKIFRWRENQAKKLDVPPSHIFQDKYLKKLKKVIDDRTDNDLRWIIKNEPSRINFSEFFL